MKYESKPNEGGLWALRERTNDKSPDYTGYVGVDVDVLKDLIEKTKAGQPARIRIISYTNNSESGGTWYKLYSHKDEPRQRGLVTPTNRPPARPTRPVRTEPKAADFSLGHDLNDDIPF